MTSYNVDEVGINYTALPAVIWLEYYQYITPRPAINQTAPSHSTMMLSRDQRIKEDQGEIHHHSVCQHDCGQRNQ